METRLVMSEVNPNTDMHVGTIAVDHAKVEKLSLIDIKNGKLVFRQKSISFEKLSETLREIVQFREMLQKHIDRQDPPLTTIPDYHKPLIAKLGHESDKTLSALTKHIRQELLPAQNEDDESSVSAANSLPPQAVESAIKSVLDRNNYGLDSTQSNRKIPASLCVWRWEVKEQHRDWLPSSVREKAEVRLAERIQAKKDLATLFNSLSLEERNYMLDPKGAAKAPLGKGKDVGDPFNAVNFVDPVVDSVALPPLDKSLKPSTEEKDNAILPVTSTKPPRPKKAADPEKLAKEQERLGRKAAKAEKERKEKEAQHKSRSLMVNFFGKAKGTGPSRVPSQEATGAIPGPSSIQSEFQKAFKPFVLKKDADVAPINWFKEARNRKNLLKNITYANEIIDVDDDDEITEIQDVEMLDAPIAGPDVGQMSVEERLRSSVSSLQTVHGFCNGRHSKRPPAKLYNPISVRSIIVKLTEAEVSGDISLVRSLLAKLQDRTLLPAKVLIFHEDARPGYFGTWTRDSQVVGPRTPLARDVLALDYGYDSGEEWEEEGAGDADDVVEDADEEDAEADDADSDLESWLVDDDDMQEVGTSLEERDVSPLPEIPVPAAAKRKAETGERKLEKKRKVVVPLVPFAKGPCWESTIGRCEYEPFIPYKIQLFNDTPFPIDPFTFVSTCTDLLSSNTKSTSAPVFAVPALPDHLSVPASSSSDTTGSTTSIPTTSIKRPASTPKTSFPDAHLPFLLTKITSLQAVSMTFLVEAIYQDLRVYKVKKNAIEAKVREVGEKSKDKVWVVKSDAFAVAQSIAQP